MFNNADLTFPEVENEKGEKLPLTQGRYIAYMKSSDRVLRKNAFEALYGAYAKFQNTLGAAYDANARQAAFFAGSDDTRMRWKPRWMQAGFLSLFTII